MATYKIRVLSAAICAFTLGAQLEAGAADLVAPLASGGDHASVSDVSATETASKAESKELKGGVSKTEVAPEALIDQLTQTAYERGERVDEIAQKEGKYKGTFRRSFARVSDMAQFMTAYKGFQASSEAADVILAEKEKLKSRAAVDWIKQKQHDELHPKIVSSLMQIASGLGMSDPAKQQKHVDAGYKQLSSLVGEEDAKRALTAMTAWASSVKDSAPPAASQESLSVLQMDAATKKIIEGSLVRDDVVLETKAKLHKYNHRSKLMMATAKVVNTTLSVAMFSPTFVSPAAQIMLLAFLSSTGGPEEAKLLKELYLDRRIECRYKMLNQEANQALSNYNVAAITGNTVLSQFCALSAGKLAGKDALSAAITEFDTTSDSVAAPDSTPAANAVSTNAVSPNAVAPNAVAPNADTNSANDVLLSIHQMSKKSAKATDNAANANPDMKPVEKSNGVGMNQPGTSL